MCVQMPNTEDVQFTLARYFGKSQTTYRRKYGIYRFKSYTHVLQSNVLRARTTLGLRKKRPTITRLDRIASQNTDDTIKPRYLRITRYTNIIQKWETVCSHKPTNLITVFRELQLEHTLFYFKQKMYNRI